jgi:hypothetical protein
MAWTYSDWRSQSGASAQRARLILHMQEIDNAITAAIGDQGKNRDPTNLNMLAERLQKQLDRLDKQLGTAPESARIGLADFRPGRR